MCGLTPLFIVSRPKAISTHTQLHKITKFLPLFLTPPPKMKNTPITFKKNTFKKYHLYHIHIKKSPTNLSICRTLCGERGLRTTRSNIVTFKKL